MNAYIISFFAIIAVGAFLFTQSSRAEPSQDRQVILQLQKAGSDISKPHNIDFFFYFPTLEAANRIAERLKSEGFSAKAGHAAKGENFIVEATKSLIPAESTLVNLRHKFNQMSASENGDYDGWGSEIVK